MAAGGEGAKQVPASAARAELGQLAREAARGQSIIITQRGEQVAALRACAAEPGSLGVAGAQRSFTDIMRQARHGIGTTLQTELGHAEIVPINQGRWREEGYDASTTSEPWQAPTSEPWQPPASEQQPGTRTVRLETALRADQPQPWSLHGMQRSGMRLPAGIEFDRQGGFPARLSPASALGFSAAELLAALARDGVMLRALPETMSWRLVHEQHGPAPEFDASTPGCCGARYLEARQQAVGQEAMDAAGWQRTRQAARKR